jgi:exopolysaccharide production protein ExoY
MLVRMPQGPVNEKRVRPSEECDSFEAALSRDLASAPVVSYESSIGGWTKRVFDIAATMLTAPVWLVLVLIAGLIAKLRHRDQVFFADERVGYGGRPYQCFHLRLDPSLADVLVLRPEHGEAQTNDLAAIALKSEDGRAKWRDAFERLPQMLNVLLGDMSLVGPAPLARVDVEPLKTAKRYYLSARPGVVGISGLVSEHEERAAQYKIYSLCWSLATDVNLLLTASVSLHKRGTLWKPKRGESQFPQNDQAAARRGARAEGRIG